MQLSQLIKDPFPGFANDEEVSPAEMEGRLAAREILEQALNDPTLSQAVRTALANYQKAAGS